MRTHIKNGGEGGQVKISKPMELKNGNNTDTKIWRWRAEIKDYVAQKKMYDKKALSSGPTTL